MPDPPTPGGNSIRRNIFYAVLGNGFLNLSRLAVLVVLGKAAGALDEVGVELQGIYTYTLSALAGPVIMFCSLELRAAFVSDTRDEFSFGTYRALRYVGLGLAAILLCGIILWMNRENPSIPVIWMMLAICAGRIVFQLAEVCWGVFQRRERLGLMAGSNALRGVVLLLPFVILFRWGPTLGLVNLEGLDQVQLKARLVTMAATAVTCYVGAWLVIWWFFDRRLVVKPRDMDLSWSWRQVWKLARRTLPLGLVFLLIHLCDTVTYSAVKGAGAGEGWTDAGFYGTIKFIALATMFLIVQVNTAAGNRLAQAYRTDLKAFVRLGVNVAAVALAIGAAFVGFVFFHGEWILRILYTPEHAKYQPEFLLMIIAQSIVLLAAVFGAVTTYMRQFWIQVPVHLTVLAATAIAAALFIHKDNPVHGGALTEIVRSTAQAVLYLACVLIGLHWRGRIVNSESDSGGSSENFST